MPSAGRRGRVPENLLGHGVRHTTRLPTAPRHARRCRVARSADGRPASAHHGRMERDGVRLATLVVVCALIAGGCASGSEADNDALPQKHATATPVSPPQTASRPHVPPISTRWLERRGILTSAAHRQPEVTAAQAIQRARMEFSAGRRRVPAARLYRVTVTDFGRPDHSQKYGYDLLIDHRLAWVLTFPKRRVYGSHTSWSDEAATGVARPVVFIDAISGDFLMAETF